MIFRKLLSATLLATILTSPVFAAAGLSEEQTSRLLAALERNPMGLKVAEIEASEIAGLYAVQFENGPVVYTTVSGDHFVLGDMYAVDSSGFTNLAEQRRDSDRKAKMDSVPLKDMIVFSPVGKPRAHISVFTDTSCFYCQKLHKEVPELNRRGIEVRYLAYPRSGVDSEGYRQLVSAWCAKNPQESLTKFKNKEPLAINICEDNPVVEQYRLGQALGVRGTPAMVTMDGRMVPGYQSADDLMVTLGLDTPK